MTLAKKQMQSLYNVNIGEARMFKPIMTLAKKQMQSLYNVNIGEARMFKPIVSAAERDWIYYDIEVGGKNFYETTLDECRKALGLVKSRISSFSYLNDIDRKRIIDAFLWRIEKLEYVHAKKSERTYLSNCVDTEKQLTTTIETLVELASLAGKSKDTDARDMIMQCVETKVKAREDIRKDILMLKGSTK